MESIKHVEVNNQDVSGTNGDQSYRKTVVNKTDTYAGTSGVATNIAYLAYGILATLLGIRVLLTLLIANRANTFANFIYGITNPFVTPFKSLFGVDAAIGESGSRFELETVVAILSYGILAWIIVSIITIGKPKSEDI